MWARFTPTEMARRWGLARRLMDRHDLRALLLFGNSGVNRHNQANVFWLSNHLDLHHCYLLAPRDEAIEPALYTGLGNHVPDARRIAQVPLVAWGGHDPVATVATRLRATGITRGRLGVVGVNATFGIGMPYQHHATLRRTLPGLELVDVTADLAELRAVKSEEEIGWLRRAAEYTDRAMDALRAEVRPGIPEYALLAIVEGAYRSDGGLPHIAFVRSMPMAEPNGCLPAQNPSGRLLGEGDVIITEISASYWGYSGQIHRPVFVRAEPTAAWQRLFDAALDAYRRIVRVMRPGGQVILSVPNFGPTRPTSSGPRRSSGSAATPSTTTWSTATASTSTRRSSTVPAAASGRGTRPVPPRPGAASSGTWPWWCSPTR